MRQAAAIAWLAVGATGALAADLIPLKLLYFGNAGTPPDRALETLLSTRFEFRSSPVTRARARGRA